MEEEVINLKPIKLQKQPQLILPNINIIHNYINQQINKPDLLLNLNNIQHKMYKIFYRNIA